MSSFSPLVSRLSYAVFCVLRSVRLTDQTHADKQSIRQRAVIRQAICIEAAVASTLVVYIGWLCIRKWFFEELIITPDNMLRGCVFVLVAALGAKLFWIVWSTCQSWLNRI